MNREVEEVEEVGLFGFAVKILKDFLVFWHFRSKCRRHGNRMTALVDLRGSGVY
jgi:hypothetical protein